MTRPHHTPSMTPATNRRAWLRMASGMGLGAAGLALVDTLSQTIEAHYAWVESQLGKPKLTQLYALLDELIALEQPADLAGPCGPGPEPEPEE